MYWDLKKEFVINTFEVFLIINCLTLYILDYVIYHSIYYIIYSMYLRIGVCSHYTYRTLIQYFTFLI